MFLVYACTFVRFIIYCNKVYFIRAYCTKKSRYFCNLISSKSTFTPVCTFVRLYAFGFFKAYKCLICHVCTLVDRTNENVQNHYLLYTKIDEIQ